MSAFVEGIEDQGSVLAVMSNTSALGFVVDIAGGILGAHVTCAATAADGLDIDCIDTHDVVVAEAVLPDMCGLDFARNIIALRDRPVILIASSPETDDVIDAMRLGVTDYLRLPLDQVYLRETLERSLFAHRAVSRDMTRRRNHRALLRRVLRDRRQLNQRIDLICKDLVGAHRKLFHRVLAMQDSQAG